MTRVAATGLGPTAQAVSEGFGVGTGGGDLLAGDHPAVGARAHRGERGTAGVVVGAFY
ncbi:hypothetical protein ACFYO5_31270 [Streptomyces sp. NPDC006259]|uniref:hypothetical protein n=1 Tax=Streptomyces sp. NPDC006259 TaxID=3364740 RepID=UPI00368A7DA6